MGRRHSTVTVSDAGVSFERLPVATGRGLVPPLRDEQTVLPVSPMTAGQHGVSGVYLSLPCVVGRGVVGRVIELPLDEAERAGLHASAGVLRRTLDGLSAGNTAPAV